MSFERVVDLSVTLLVLLSIFVLAYCKITKKTFSELISEIKEAIKPEVEEVILP